MVVVHHCCQLGLGGKHITAPFYLCRHLGLFAITEYDMTALQSALKFYWLLGQVPWLQSVLQAGSLMGSPGALTACSEVLWGGWGGGLSRGCSPLALRKQPGKEFMGRRPAGVCVSTHPRRAGDRLPCDVPWGGPQRPMQSLSPPGLRLNTHSCPMYPSSSLKESPGGAQALLSLGLVLIICVLLWSEIRKTAWVLRMAEPRPAMQLD